MTDCWPFNLLAAALALSALDALGHTSYGERQESTLDFSIIILSCRAGLAVEQPDPSWGREGIPKCFQEMPEERAFPEEPFDSSAAAFEGIPHPLQVLCSYVMGK